MEKYAFISLSSKVGNNSHMI